jgi:hypothetical protein
VHSIAITNEDYHSFFKTRSEGKQVPLLDILHDRRADELNGCESSRKKEKEEEEKKCKVNPNDTHIIKLIQCVWGFRVCGRLCPALCRGHAIRVGGRIGIRVAGIPCRFPILEETVFREHGKIREDQRACMCVYGRKGGHSRGYENIIRKRTSLKKSMDLWVSLQSEHRRHECYKMSTKFRESETQTTK